MKTATTPPHRVTLILMTGLSVLTLNMILPALNNIARDLQADYALVSVAVAGYLAVSAGVFLIAGPLSDRIGRRPVVLGAIAIFIASSVACSLVENVWAFLAFRMVQAAMVACGTVSMAVVRDTSSPRESASILAYIGMAMALAPMLGPVLGGIIDTAFGWRAVFWFYAVSGVALFALVWVDQGETLDRAKSPPTGSLRNIAILLSEQRFWAFAICSAFSVGAFFTFLTGVPLVAERAFGVTSAETGFFIGSITLGFMFGSFLSGRIGPRYHLTTMMLVGRITAVSGLFVGFTALSLGWVSPYIFFGGTIFVGIGNGITLPNTNAGVMSVRDGMSGTAAGLQSAFMSIVGAILTMIAGVVISRWAEPQVLIGLMLIIVSIALASAFWSRRLETAQDAAENPA
ncbi:MAG: multidrug effflux MFS transporter [Boseongicola sp.]|nr:multidrug effflux MFS transporter [Boseongicola sp.]